MSYVITLISPQQQASFEDGPLNYLAGEGLKIKDRAVLAPGLAADAFASSPCPKALMDMVREKFGIDIICQHRDLRHRKLFIADMDATIVAEETLDEVAAHAGIKDRIAAITLRGLKGEIDFADGLRERMALLKGLPVAALEETAAKMTLNPGAEVLLQTLKNRGLYCVLVSGGFTFFTGRIADTLGFDEDHGNVFAIEDGKLAGAAVEPIRDKSFKRQCLVDTAERLGIPLSETIAIGDGANDLPMLQAAGLGIGWRSKPLLREALDNHILFCGLDAILYALGFGVAVRK